jgi:hypothetical protein
MARGDVVGDVDGANSAGTRDGVCDGENGDALGALDALHTSLDCPICGTWFSAPLLLTVCGHSFCAACIRENFDYQERTTVKEGGRLGCPLCRQVRGRWGVARVLICMFRGTGGGEALIFSPCCVPFMLAI